MGKKIALLIGISDYQEVTKLPACEADLFLISEIIRNTGKYDELTVLDRSPESDKAKEKISSFVRKYQNQEVDEIFFYYTGHGMRYLDDFLFLFSDFTTSKIEQTSLSNSELDSMLKSLNPELAVKVIDACHCGTEYIKSAQDLEAIFKKSSTDSFKKIYFLFSSSEAESSIALNDYSVFTKSFAKSLVNYTGSSIRYRDIMASISDDLSVAKYQTPLFIQQANNTEIFCTLSADLVDLVATNLGVNREGFDREKDGERTDADVQTYEDSLIEEIKAKGKEFCTQEEAQASLKNFIENVKNFNWGYLIDRLYEVTVDEELDYSSIKDMKSIAKWLSDSHESYFAEVTYTEEAYEAKEKVEIIEESPFSLSSLFSTKRVEYKPVIESLNRTWCQPYMDVFLKVKHC